MDIYNLVSLLGLVGVLALGWVLSADRRRMNWRCILAGTGIALAIGAVVFTAPGSTRAFLWLNDVVVKVLSAATAGQQFLFGVLAVGPGQTGPGGEKSLGFILAVQALPVIIFFAALMGLLYYWGVMPLLVRGFAWLFTRLMRISGAESLCTASEIFVGIESATTIRPYLPEMTRSELCTILTAGMATVAGSTLAVYVMFLGDVFPTIAGHLISASVMSAPAAIVMSKILLPETGQPVTLGRTVRAEYPRESGAIESVVSGAMAGVKLVVGVVALLIAFLGMIAIADLLLGWLAGGCEHVVTWAGARAGTGWQVHLDWSLGRLLGYVMWPLAVLVGVPPADAHLAGNMLGERMIATEVPAYLHLAEAVRAGAFRHPRSPVLIAYGLCGFAHVASLAIFVGGVAALVPERRKDLAAVGPRALLAATLACLLTAAVAGVFFHETLSVAVARGVSTVPAAP